MGIGAKRFESGGRGEDQRARKGGSVETAVALLLFLLSASGSFTY